MAPKTQATPTARVLPANPVHTLTDSNGRQISWSPLSVLQQARLMRSVGSEHSNNQAFMGVAVLAACVVDIDGVPCPRAQTLLQVDAAIERLGDEGYAAVVKSMAALRQDDDEDAHEATVSAAKN
jgi:hypothetical protein